MHTCPCRGWPSISQRTQRCALGFPESSRDAGLRRRQFPRLFPLTSSAKSAHVFHHAKSAGSILISAPQARLKIAQRAALGAEVREGSAPAEGGFIFSGGA